MWMSVRNMCQLSAIIAAMKTQNQYCSNICTFGICKEGPIALTVLLSSLQNLSSFFPLHVFAITIKQPKVNGVWHAIKCMCQSCRTGDNLHIKLLYNTVWICILAWFASGFRSKWLFLFFLVKLNLNQLNYWWVSSCFSFVLNIKAIIPIVCCLKYCNIILAF